MRPKRESVSADIQQRKYRENQARNRAALNAIIKDIKAGNPVSQKDQLNMALLAAWALFQAQPALWRAHIELEGEAKSKVFMALWHFSDQWAEDWKK